MNKLAFNGTWRAYQQRILDNLSLHLTDNKIHVVAAPGAGKTTLGIEVIARLNRPTLILVPTITIRAQWKQRLVASFLNGNSEDIISTNIKDPRFITITTYQALLAAFCGKEELAETEETEDSSAEEETEKENAFVRLNQEKAQETIELLKKAHIDLLCFDEAHHLRNEWWKALTYLLEHLQPKQTISLTATPPYDADTAEWERYSSLCGSIDEVISIPELVQNDDLCPHQDFVHFSVLRQNESEEINKAIRRTTAFITSLPQQAELLQLVADYLEKEKEDVILDTPKTYIALAAFLKWAGRDIPPRFLDLFGFKQRDIPAFNEIYQKLFLSFVLFKHPAEFAADKTALLEELISKAKAAGVVANKAVFINDGPRLKRQIANSLGKLDSIKEIVEQEARTLGKDLRLVVLADYIKYDITDCSALGVIPIWQMLSERTDILLGVLTGSIILLPQKTVDEFQKRIDAENLAEYISVKPFERNQQYYKVTVKGNKKAATVRLITQLFNEGYLTVLVGTQALLGEGWDAPSINSLILSSTVSSYMLSNQMRGRAIRRDKNNPDKVANIWHLASIKILSQWEQFKQSLPSATQTEEEPTFQLFDYAQLEQRFKGYEAPGIEAPYYIENGIDRIFPSGWKKSFLFRAPKESDFIALNEEMKSRARNRQLTKKLWEDGLIKKYNAPEKSLRTGVSTTAKMKFFFYRGGYLSILTSYTIVAFVLMTPALAHRNWGAVLLVLLGLLAFLVKPTYKFLRCSSPEKVMRQIGIVVLETLSYMGLIKTSLQHVNLKSQENPDGSIFFSVTNVSPEENNLIIKCMREILDPIENPRYVFMRKGNVGSLPTTDYHALPAVIGQKKEYVMVFQKLWEKYIGECQVIYTRSKEGRRVLLRARKAAFSSLMDKPESKKLSRYE